MSQARIVRILLQVRLQRLYLLQNYRRQNRVGLFRVLQMLERRMPEGGSRAPWLEWR